MKILAGLLLAASPLAGQPYTIDGTVCRMSRSVDRMIIGTDDGQRTRVVLRRSTPVSFEGSRSDRGDLRLGDRVHLIAHEDGSHMDADSIEVRLRTADALLDSLLGSHRTIVGRFAVREAKTEFFSLSLPGGNYARVDAKSAYGPNGRVRVSSLKPGDLLEIRGNWPKKGLLKASSIRVMTDTEPSFCQSHARRGESSETTKMREADERKLLNAEDGEDE
ncbi:MAG TPA: hypothetical protein VIO12_08950 [Thermoanaerobaculia bacterium]